MNPRASVLVPTHSRAEALTLSVESVLAQTVGDLEVLIIGDGVTDEVRASAVALVRTDLRVRFLDNEKGANHGEIYRHDAILAAQSDAIFYLCDDDLFMPDHVSDLLALLADHSFVQCLNGWITPAESVDFYPADLADPRTIRWMLDSRIRWNVASLSGTAHSKSVYLKSEPWTTTPHGEWPDHVQWRKILSVPGVTGATSSRMTALQFPSEQDGRENWTPAQRVAEQKAWATVAKSADGQQKVDALVDAALLPRVIRDNLRLAEMMLTINTLNDERAALERTLSWRITRPIRALRGLGQRNQ